jgi:hypothetical protein
MNARNTALSMIVGSLMLVACDTGNRPVAPDDPMDPSLIVSGRIVPQSLVLSPLTGVRCPFLTPFTTRFDLLVDLAGSREFFLDQVTFRLSDGSSVGGSPVLMSASDLAARFASTRIVPGTTSRFGFAPRFECGRFVPRSLFTDVVLRDGAGARRTTHLVVPIG